MSAGFKMAFNIIASLKTILKEQFKPPKAEGIVSNVNLFSKFSECEQL